MTTTWAIHVQIDQFVYARQKSRGDFINNDPMFRAQLLENGFVMNADEEHRNIIKELILSYDNPGKSQNRND